MKIALELTSALDVKSRTIDASFPDFIAFEGKLNRSVSKFETEITLTDLAYLGCHAEHRLKKTGLDFDSWCDEIESLSLGDANDGVIVPLEISQPTG